MNETQLYPLKFEPILKDKIWGGVKLKTLLNKRSSDICGESWEVSGIQGDESVVANGQLAGMKLSELITTFGEKLLGSNVSKQFGNEFPLLIKFIDANADLSIQVHPNDEQSDGEGKNEMWYVMAADEGATLLSGFNREVKKEELRRAIENGTFEGYMNKLAVKKGDAFFIEANQVHTIGKGILIAEIQQSSDITYRLYDFDRVDDQGNKRELHVDKSFDVLAINQNTGRIQYNNESEVQLLKRPEFVTDRLIVTDRKPQVENENFMILIGVDGQGVLKWRNGDVELKTGETLFIPAKMEIALSGNPELTVLKTYLEI